jgi:tetratricopeptide (TPR) repeat protein/tRNA A-37 threonylcarbamoyl transferase component Bud32
MVVIPSLDQSNPTGKGRMSAASSDRNLLFGILALQVNFITRDALVKGIHAWALQKHRPLGALLVEQGALRQDLHDALEVMVGKHLEMHGGDPQKSLAVISSAGSVGDDLQQIGDAGLQASVSLVTGTTSVQTDPWRTQPVAGSASAPAVRYRRLRPHARGGLGEVFVALDEELGREVALKEIQDHHADRADNRARFVLEAEVTGKLEHPGVVPVYGLGRYPDGRPFYAMRFIKGDSLKEAIERFHHQSFASVGERAVELRGLLGRFLDVCDAVAYAHSRGVLHRDLKPGNVMLGRYGETLVVDWGLAKLLGRTDVAAASEDVPITTTSTGDVTPTQAGSMIGTPQFMSPEQAAGRLDLLGPASDVYSLGATLYCLLTGRAPFPGPGRDGMGALLRKVEEGEFPPPRGVKPDVPRPLEAICMKAMARRSQDRYSSVETLGRDVQQWLAGEPVSAWPEPLVVKAGRWVRKHQVPAAATAAALVVALVLGSAGAVWWQQQQERERQARLARQEQAAERALAAIEQASALRTRMRWVEARGLLRQAGEAATEAGDEDVTEQLRQAEADLDLVEELHRVREGTTATVAGKFVPGRGRNWYAAVFRKHGLDVLDGPIEALARRIRASAVREEVLAGLDAWAPRETQANARRLLEVAWRADPGNRWRKLLRRPDIGDDRQRLRPMLRDVPNQEDLPPTTAFLLAGLLGVRTPEAVELLARVRERHPDDFWLNLVLGWVLTVPREKYVDRRDSRKQGEAIGYCRAALAIKRDSAVAHILLAVALRGRGDLDGAMRNLQVAIRLDSKLAVAHANLGVVLRDRKDLKGAIRSLREAIRLDPTLAEAHSLLGIALLDTEDREGALRSCREAVRLDAEDALGHANLGLVQFTTGDVDGAIRSYRAALRLDPLLAGIHTNLGAALSAKGEHDEALGSFREAVRLLPDDATAHNNLALGLLVRGDVEEAIRSHREAIRLDPRLAVAHAGLGHALMQYGDFVAAGKSFQQASGLLPPKSPLAAGFAGQVVLCEQMHRLGQALDGVVAGKHTPGSAVERTVLATIAGRPGKQYYATAVRLFLEAFEAQPALGGVVASHRYNAACAAARAGTAQGKDAGPLGDTARAAMRYRALCWLQDELNAHGRKGGEQMRLALLHWRRDGDLAAVRDAPALGKLPESEQVAWRNLWAQVAGLLARTASGK